MERLLRELMLDAELNPDANLLRNGCQEYLLKHQRDVIGLLFFERFYIKSSTFMIAHQTVFSKLSLHFLENIGMIRMSFQYTGFENRFRRENIAQP
jgi:hypothetical protein